MILLTRSVGYAHDVNDRRELRKGTSNCVNSRELSHTERGTYGAKAAKTGVRIGSIAWRTVTSVIVRFK